jgi:hypothetical protein
MLRFELNCIAIKKNPISGFGIDGDAAWIFLREGIFLIHKLVSPA